MLILCQNMEGNLSRARSTLGHHSASSSSSFHDISPTLRSGNSPPTKLIPLQLGLPPSKRHLHSQDVPHTSPGHSRNLSDLNTNSSPFGSPNLIRSASAAARYSGIKHSPELPRESPMTGFRNSLISTPGRSVSAMNTSRLEPLSENDQLKKVTSRDSGRSSLENSSGSGSGSGDSPSLNRSSSTIHVQDLKEQMTGLKGRLSVLRDRARDDSMRRRSLQSLRTPSPFTAAEQWYAGAKGYGEGNLSADAVVTYAPWQESPISPKPESPKKEESSHVFFHAQSDVTSLQDQESEVTSHQDIPIANQTELLEDSQGEDIGIHYETAEEGDFGEDNYKDELISQSELSDYESDVYHDSYPTQVSHEDREDAFDYEHFFLHSAMGTIIQQRNGRSGSFSSDDSVETTRGPVTITPDQELEKRLSLGHLRNDSEASISTLATFATAAEGFDDDDDHNFAVQQVHPIHQERATSPPTGTKRSTFGSPLEALLKGKSQRQSAISRNNSVNRPPMNGSRQHSRNGSVVSSNGQSQQTSNSPINMLKRDDQILVEGVVAAVGKCVIGLQDADTNSYEAKVWRRRLDAARRVLEGDEGAV